ncbi:MAG: hypothetical protein JST80_06840 [Bdellovibrionales bacterium]|nr:hypothetical protein [Bdellovibrionales bacterium]
MVARKYMKRLSFIVVLSLVVLGGLAHAQSNSSIINNSDDPANGNLIPEPELKDYQAANRAPGILVEPYDVVDSDGKPADL